MGKEKPGRPGQERPGGGSTGPAPRRPLTTIPPPKKPPKFFDPREHQRELD